MHHHEYAIDAADYKPSCEMQSFTEHLAASTLLRQRIDIVTFEIIVAGHFLPKARLLMVIYIISEERRMIGKLEHGARNAPARLLHGTHNLIT